MRASEINGRVVLLALLVTFGIYLAAWGTSEDGVARADYLNQTIPTITPTGATSTPTASKPTAPPPTQAPTEPPGVPSDTPSPTSPVPSSTPTDEQTPGTATATSQPTSAPSSTPLPTGGSATPTLAQTSTTALPTAGPAIDTASPAINPMTTPGFAVESTSMPQPTAVKPAQTWAAAEPTSASAGSSLVSGSCLWMALGLILIVAGIVSLARWRRSE